ncbi:hypothetical protein GS682_31300 [Nostoc sp. B(2019)]|nr:hypothetical protein [Nostoc sp. B(2019)]
MFKKFNLLLALATGSRGYTDKTPFAFGVSPSLRDAPRTAQTSLHLRGLKTLDFSLVHGGGLGLCSSDFQSPNTFQPNGALKTEQTSFRLT